PTPQIRIEAHIVETSKDTARELGIQWGGLYHGTGGDSNYWLTPGANTGGVIGESLSEGIDPTSGMAVDFPAALGGTGLTLGFIFEKLDKYVLDVQLSALQNEGKVDILSRPSITTLDNQPAMIESGKEVPYQTTEGAGADKEVKIEWKKATLRLEVTPYVIDGKTLKMEIKINKDELDFANKVEGNPTIITKKAETSVVLFDGQTTVIGGLSKEITTDSESGVPLLKDVPLFGYLFKGKGKANEMDELLIFITPHILKQQTAAEGADREIGR
ncbi:MAG: type IV pilus secretin PilQ, partial [Thermodesulfobacteriota bacterium]|nr:type IV pilus secretin PilQ [Thermodesulfobacteriota bacterium]